MLSNPSMAMLNSSLMYIFAILYRFFMELEKALEEQYEERGNEHVASSQETPMRADAFALSDDEKITRIQDSVKDIMHTLGLDLTDDSLMGTPKRVAKMFVDRKSTRLNSSH